MLRKTYLSPLPVIVFLFTFKPISVSAQNVSVVARSQNTASILFQDTNGDGKISTGDICVNALKNGYTSRAGLAASAGQAMTGQLRGRAPYARAKRLLELSADLDDHSFCWWLEEQLVDWGRIQARRKDF